jgi:hypothetical protein
MFLVTITNCTGVKDILDMNEKSRQARTATYKNICFHTYYINISENQFKINFSSLSKVSTLFCFFSLLSCVFLPPPPFTFFGSSSFSVFERRHAKSSSKRQSGAPGMPADAAAAPHATAKADQPQSFVKEINNNQGFREALLSS